MLVGPLTNEFIPPASCISQGLGVVRYSTTGDYDYYLTAGPGASNCFPSSQFPSLSSYYSPGRCPSGYSGACTNTGGNSAGDAVETTVTCCPIMPYTFTCNSDNVGEDWGVFGDCVTTTSALTVDLSIIGAVPTSKLTDSSYDDDGNPILTSPTMNAYGIEIRWQATDEEVLGITSSSSSTSSSGSSSGSSSLTSSPSTSTTSASSGSSGGLKGGAIAGVVIGALVGLLALLAVAFFIFRSKRKQRAAQQTSTQPGPSGLQSSGTEYAYPVDENTYGAHPKHEMPTPQSTQELPAEYPHQTGYVGQYGSPQSQPRELEGTELRGELETVESRGELGNGTWRH
ncbi:hypothetical protein F5Y18DRAFT_153433 [Xylariaceae sp. FL1019]|nr:hypothetical protein F5Y18DRAFT_153433 [Xylariaceae sp. FL1019]